VPDDVHPEVPEAPWEEDAQWSRDVTVTPRDERDANEQKEVTPTMQMVTSGKTHGDAKPWRTNSSRTPQEIVPKRERAPERTVVSNELEMVGFNGQDPQKHAVASREMPVIDKDLNDPKARAVPEEHPKALSTFKRDTLIKLFKQGRTPQEIAVLSGLTAEEVALVLKGAGV
jgi:hypothetical protein